MGKVPLFDPHGVEMEQMRVCGECRAMLDEEHARDRWDSRSAMAKVFRADTVPTEHREREVLRFFGVSRAE